MSKNRVHEQCPKIDSGTVLNQTGSKQAECIARWPATIPGCAPSAPAVPLPRPCRSPVPPSAPALAHPAPHAPLAYAACAPMPPTHPPAAFRQRTCRFCRAPACAPSRPGPARPCRLRAPRACYVPPGRIFAWLGTVSQHSPALLLLHNRNTLQCIAI